jgi:hypothetical protein
MYDSYLVGGIGSRSLEVGVYPSIEVILRADFVSAE